MQANIKISGDGADLEWSAEYACDYKATAGTAASTPSGWTKMMRYNPDKGRFENNEGLSVYDSCDSNPITKYTGTPSRECVDVWLDGDPNSMIYADRGTFTVSQTDPECNAWTMDCSQYYKVVPICDQKYANYNNGMQYGYGGSDIRFALSSRNSTLSQSERWKKYVPNAAMVSKFFGKLKTTYNNWLNNGDWSLGHPYTYNICMVSADWRVPEG